MLKNWTVKTQQKKNFVSHIQYLKNKQAQSHYYSNIHTLLDNSKKILQTFEDRKAKRKLDGLRGGGVVNEATSFIFSLPRDIKQPTVNQWKKILNIAIKQMVVDINISIRKQNAKELKKRQNPNYKSKKSIIPMVTYKDIIHHSVAVLHDESASPNKHSHVHLILSNIIKNEVIKPISQHAATYAAKKGINRAISSILGIDHCEYVPKKKNTVKKPDWVIREEKVLNTEKKLNLLKNSFKNVKQEISSWAKVFLADIFAIAEKKANKVASSIDDIESVSFQIADDFDEIVDEVEFKNEKAPELSKVSNKRKKRRRKISH